MINTLADESSSSSKQKIENKYNTQTLFSGQQEILIEHAGQTYRLRITRQNKLILTK